MIMTGFGQKRIGWLYGRWVTDSATGESGVQVHAIYEPKQECTSDDINVLDGAWSVALPVARAPHRAAAQRAHDEAWSLHRQILKERSGWRSSPRCYSLRAWAS